MTDLLTPPAAPTPASAHLAGARVQVPPSLGAMLQELPALLQSTDPLAPSQAAQLLHQTARALDVVQQPGLARLLRAMEAALRQPAVPTGTAPASPHPRDVLQLAAKDAQAHLQTLQAGRRTQVTHLFPAYRAVCKLGGKDSAHPADLWELRWQLAPVPAPLPAALQVPPHRVAPSTRALLDQQVLAVVKNADAPAAARLRDLCLGLAQTCAAPADTAFWQAAAGCFDATAHGLLEQDLYTKRLASRVLMHYASVAKAGDSAVTPPPDTLVRDLLYYCAQAADTAAMVMDGLPPVLQAICHSCQLLPADAPAQVTQAAPPPGDATLTLDLGRGAEALAVPVAVAAPLHDPLAEPYSTTPAADLSSTLDDAGLNLSHLVFGDEPEAPEAPADIAEPSALPAARKAAPQPVAQTTGDLSTGAAHDAALPATAGVVEAMDTSAVPDSATALDNTAALAAAASSAVPDAAGPSEIAADAAVSAAETPAAAEPVTEPVLLAADTTQSPTDMPESVVDAALAEQDRATSDAAADSVASTTTAEAASGEHSAPNTDADADGDGDGDGDGDVPAGEAAQDHSEPLTDSAPTKCPADDGRTVLSAAPATTTDTADTVNTSADVPPPQDTAAPVAAPMDERTALATRLAAAAVPELQPGAALLQGAAGQPRAEPNQGFLTEADGLSQQLQTEITVWAAESDTPLPATAAEQARALTRSAWGAGCTEISLLTHTLQMVLERLRRNATASQRQACVHAADEVLRLLHQFAAGFMRRPHPQVLEALNHILADTVSAPPAPNSEGRPATDEAGADGAAPDRHTTFIDGTATHQAIGHEEAPAAVPVPALVPVLPSVDQLEPVRFAVFEEEVLAVWPALQTALHQWMERPAEQGTPRQTLLRSLHTLKGSARLAGAAAWASQVHALEDLALLAQPHDGPLGPSALQQPLEVLRIAFIALQQELAARHPERSLQHWGASPIDTVGRHAQALWGTHEQTQQSVADNHQMLAEMESCLQRLRAQLKDCAAWADTLVLHGDMDLSYEWHEELHDLIRGLSDGADDIGTVQRQLQHGLATADTALTTQAGHLRALQHTLLYARLTPLAQLHERLLATVELAASDTGKPTQLLLEGGDQLLERSVADQLAPALEHLLRNCVDHGIEPAARRQAAGKPATGLITVRLHTQGPVQTLTVQDDGAGLQLEHVQTKAVALGLLQPGETVDARRAAELILHPGLSTAAQITELSGRGIGMDAVQAGVQQLGGQLHIDSQPGQGCTFTITLPAPPQVEQVVALRAGSWSIALPARSIEAVRHIPAAQMDEAVAQGMLPDDVTGPMPLYWAGAVWQQSARSSAPPVDGQSIALVVRSDTSRWALQVDEVLGTQEVALQPPAEVAVPLPGLLGTAAQPSGQVLQVYDPYAALAAHEARRLLQSAQPVAASDDASAPEVPPPLVLIADDSMSVRRLAQHLLQTQGYRVATAADGLLAWQLLEDGELPALLLADIEMPEMDGLELLRRVRADARCKQLPVVMLTAHEAGPVSQKAIDAGAQAFLTKPYAPNELLALVRRCARVPESDLQP
ncbi:response regulator [Comamonas terrigena]|uniref:hybrid sensor histidine kinase/response regulator n=1 Tax=Comamonas terrigena TaxID=32013 RepID=UPI002446B2D2|nr:response regulator [Comamonas terrigena]MDH1701201.1 response regulator [Comamonas terrigena]